jgi:hypothetical protein
MEIDLIVKCPDTTCMYTNEDTQWYCSGCGSKCVLTDNGYIKCSSYKRCFHRFIQFTDFLCRCFTHKMNNRFSSNTDFLLALSQSIRASKINRQYDEKTRAKFITNLTININSNWEY